jgi:DivIVA domain-containing protein
MTSTMPLTPADIHNTVFAKASVTKRGYDEEQVDALLDAASHSMIQLLEENDRLRNRARQADAIATREVAADGNAQAEAELYAITDELNRARHAYERAAQHAQMLRRDLDQARRALATAAPAPRPDANNDRVLAVAQRTADDHLQHALQESHELVAEARRQSERIGRQARLTVDDIEQGARQFDGDTTAALESGRAALLREIEALTGLAEGYRAALAEHIVRQEQQLEDTAEQPVA